MTAKKDTNMDLEDIINSGETSWHDDHVNGNSDEVRKKDSRLGRPKVSASKKLKPRYSVNLNDSEYEKLKAHCESLGVTVSQFTRMRLLESIK